MLTVINRTSFSEIDSILPSLIKEGKKLLDYVAYSEKKKWDEVNVVLIEEREMRDFHYRFLSKKSVTDVLTFVDEKENQVSGDVALCLQEILKNADFYQLSQPYLFYETMLHGFLHLYGLDHDYEPSHLKQIYSLQKKILEKTKPDESFLDVFQKIKF